jgi:hypothetical protein
MIVSGGYVLFLDPARHSITRDKRRASLRFPLKNVWRYETWSLVYLVLTVFEDIIPIILPRLRECLNFRVKMLITSME